MVDDSIDGVRSRATSALQSAQGRRRIGLGIALAAVLLVAIGGPALLGRVPKLADVDCEELRQLDEEASLSSLQLNLQHQLAAGELQLANSRRELAALQSRVDEAQERADEQVESLPPLDRALAEAEAATEPDQDEIDFLTQQIKQLEAEIDTPQLLEAEKAPLEADVLSHLNVLKVKSSRLIEVHTAQQAFPGADTASLTDRIDDLSRQQEDREKAIAEESGLQPPPISAVPARSTVNLQPVEPVALLAFGSDRGSHRTEVLFESSNFVASDGATPSEATVEVEAVELPDRALYRALPGTLSRDDGTEIPTDDIQVWVRRIGSTVLMSVCISPDANLPAGTYEGDVYLVDPTLNSARIPVEVTAQLTWIGVLYFLLPVLPILSLVYVWYTGRVAAAENPWDGHEFMNWLKINFVLLFGVGFASVWATLQVAFNNPTWGSTLFGSAAVVGAGLIASVTAVTAVAGRVLGEEIERR